MQQLVNSMVVRALDSVGYKFGPAHTDIKFKNGIPYIIEINPLLADGLPPVMLNKLTEKDIFEQALKSLIFNSSERNNIDLEVALNRNKFSAITFGFANKTVRVQSINCPFTSEDIVIKKLRNLDDIVGGYNDFRDRYLCVVGVDDKNIESQ
ncbi:MAG: hypothetical protein CENE_01006 [Candidatus Celerinatantimonas neptuna]|nr:MAG: hypothetical protein CENE_01006 [Candidatus Celerinatantimonas neptuna]